MQHTTTQSCTVSQKPRVVSVLADFLCAIASTSETITSISKEGRQQEHKTLAKESLFEGTQAKL